MDRDTFVNPNTGRRVQLGSRTHQELVKKHVSQIPALPLQKKSRTSASKKTGRKPSFSTKPVRKMSDSQLAHLKSIEKKAAKNKWYSVTPIELERHGTKIVDRRGSATRGWGKRKPESLSDRRKVHQMYGDDCFLLPDEELKFPICVKNGFPKSPSELPPVSCQGIAAARMRAKQHGYTDVRKTADRLYTTLKCEQPFPPILE